MTTDKDEEKDLLHNTQVYANVRLKVVIDVLNVNQI